MWLHGTPRNSTELDELMVDRTKKEVVEDTMKRYANSIVINRLPYSVTDLECYYCRASGTS
jgi:hypothetical protein